MHEFLPQLVKMALNLVMIERVCLRQKRSGKAIIYDWSLGNDLDRFDDNPSYSYFLNFKHSYIL